MELLDFLSIERVVITGWSMGVQIALRLYERAPERIAALVLVSGTPCFCQQHDWQYGLPRAEVRRMHQRLARNYTTTAGEFFKLMFTPRELENRELVRLAGAVVTRLPELTAALAALDELEALDIRGSLPGIAAPALFIHGNDDTICSPDASRYMAASMPCAELELFPNTGHAPFLSHVDTFNTLIVDFIRANNVGHCQI
jgi:pimeloyl-[acyl-carrier protein] methyl ester esterase